MYIHIYNEMAWGYTEEPLAEIDIKITKEEQVELEKKFITHTCKIKNVDGITIEELFEFTERVEEVSIPSENERIQALEEMILSLLGGELLV